MWGPFDSQACFVLQIAAEEEGNRLRQLQLEKQARLKHFQNEVKKRVNRLDRLKKQAMLETNVRAVCIQHYILSFFTSTPHPFW